MKYIVYIDRLFLLQAVQTLALLLLTGAFLNWRAPSVATSIFRLVLGSGAEALFFCAVFLLPGIGSLPKRILLAAGTLAGLLLIFPIRLPGLLLLSGGNPAGHRPSDQAYPHSGQPVHPAGE